MTIKIPSSSETYNIEGNADVDGTLNVDGATTLVSTLGVTGATTLTGDAGVGKITATKGVQNSAVALTASASGVAIPAGTSFVDVTSANAAYRVKLPTPVLGNAVYLKANGTYNFELTTAVNTQYINNTECTGTTSKELVCTCTDTQFAVCTSSGATGKWIVAKISNVGASTGGGTPD